LTQPDNSLVNRRTLRHHNGGGSSVQRSRRGNGTEMKSRSQRKKDRHDIMDSVSGGKNSRGFLLHISSQHEEPIRGKKGKRTKWIDRGGAERNVCGKRKRHRDTSASNRVRLNPGFSPRECGGGGWKNVKHTGVKRKRKKREKKE